METLYQIDCMDFMANIAANTFNMTLTDIPYGEVNQKPTNTKILRFQNLHNRAQADTLTMSLDDLTKEIIRITSGSVYMFCGIQQISQITAIMRENGLSTRLCIWDVKYIPNIMLRLLND